MDVGLISRRYAIALWRYAVKNNQEDIVYSESLTISHAYVRYPTLKRVLSNRILSNEKKIEIILALFGAFVSNEFKQFVHLIVMHNREEFLQNMCLSFQEIYRKEKQILNVEIVTAKAIDKEIEQRFLQQAELKSGQNVSLTTKVDPAIIGGYVVRWSTFRLDASTASKLRRLRQSITENLEEKG